MTDVQNGRDDRNITLEEAGVKDLLYPVTILDRSRERQRTVAAISMSVELPHRFRGTHMSRFLEVLERHSGDLDGYTIPVILEELKTVLDARAARMTVEFPYFMERKAPVTGAVSKMDYRCAFRSSTGPRGDDFVLCVSVPVTSLCPCSREISGRGAHNQRARITMEVRSVTGNDGSPVMVWIEELVEVAERSASSPLYSLLKRPDEKYVTERAYDNPVFVEDMVRNVSENFREDPRISWFRVRAESFESIHNHTAYASYQWCRE